MPSSNPPLVKWFRFNDSLQQFVVPSPYEWNAGIVEAGSESTVDANCEFYVWNNFGRDDVLPPGTTYDGVADMINVRISVKDQNGTDEDVTICGGAGAVGPNGTRKQATVYVQYYNDSEADAGDKWGYWTLQNPPQWYPNEWVPLTSATPQIIHRASGKHDKGTYSGGGSGGTYSFTQSGGSVVGSKHDNVNWNSSAPLEFNDNYIRLKLKIAVLGTADAGTIRWINRISYQYE